jgi:protein-disulfide isomerase
MTSSPKDSKRSLKEKAAAARAAAEAEQRRRDRRVRILGGIAILVAVGLIFGAVFYNNSQKTTTGSATGTVADAKVPKGVLAADPNAWGVPYNSVAGKPTLAIWEDFQCPSCASFEKSHGADLLKLADAGKVNLVWRTTAFLDARFAATSPNPNSSIAAAQAWGCAIDAGQTQAYHSTVFANQPANEGDGYSQATLLGFGQKAGITGAAYTTFEACVKASTYKDWVNNSYQAFQDTGVTGTPTAYLNGTEVPAKTLNDLTALEALIASTPAS